MTPIPANDDFEAAAISAAQARQIAARLQQRIAAGEPRRAAFGDAVQALAEQTAATLTDFHRSTRKERPMSKPRGFAAMNPDKRREIARKGGASVPAEKRSFSLNRDLATTAGRRGGQNGRGGGRTAQAQPA